MRTWSIMPLRAVASVAVIGVVIAGLAVPTVAAAAPSITGHVQFGNASITQHCDVAGAVTSTDFSVDYDGSQLGTNLSVIGGHSVISAGSTVSEAPGPIIGVAQAGHQGTLSRTVDGLTGTSRVTDVFAVNVRDTAGAVNDTVLQISALHECATGAATTVTRELTAPAAAVSDPDCTGAVTIAVDNTSDQIWTPYVYRGAPGAPVAEAAVPAHTRSVISLDMGNARSSTLGVTFRTTRAASGYTSEQSDGGLDGLLLPAAQRCAATARGAIQPVTPTRLVDTRTGTGAARSPLAAGDSLVVRAGGTATIPSGAQAAVVNVTVVAQHTGFLQAWSGTAGPDTGSVSNFAAGRTVANTLLAPLDLRGRFSVRNASTGSLALVVDVTGYVLGGPAASQAGDFVPQDAVRLYDSRTAGTKAAIAPGATLHVPVANQQGIPTSAGTVAARVTATASARGGYLTVWTGEGAAPGTSAVNFAAGQSTGTLTAVPIAADGTIAVTNHSSGTVHVLVDSEGWWRAGAGTSTGSFDAVAGRRLLDTRNAGPSIAAHASRQIDMLGAGGSATHLHGLAAAVVTVTVPNAAATGFVSVRSSADFAAPTTSSLNFAARTTVSNTVIVPVGDDGQITIYNGAAEPTDVVIDITGYVTR